MALSLVLLPLMLLSLVLLSYILLSLMQSLLLPSLLMPLSVKSRSWRGKVEEVSLKRRAVGEVTSRRQHRHSWRRHWYCYRAYRRRSCCCR
jgi:hypothetical protein